MATETEMYELHCKDQFKGLKDDNTEIKGMVTKLSDRLLKSNGQRSVVACVEDNAQNLKRHVEASAAVKTIKRLKIGRLVDIQGFSGSDVVKIMLMVTLFVYILGRDHGEKVLNFIHGEPAEVVKVD